MVVGHPLQGYHYHIWSIEVLCAAVALGELLYVASPTVRGDSQKMEGEEELHPQRYFY